MGCGRFAADDDTVMAGEGKGAGATKDVGLDALAVALVVGVLEARAAVNLLDSVIGL